MLCVSSKILTKSKLLCTNLQSQSHKAGEDYHFWDISQSESAWCLCVQFEWTVNLSLSLPPWLCIYIYICIIVGWAASLLKQLNESVLKPTLFRWTMFKQSWWDLDVGKKRLRVSTCMFKLFDRIPRIKGKIGRIHDTCVQRIWKLFDV